MVRQELKQRYSAAIGIVGGLVDLITGVALLRPTMMADNAISVSLGTFLLVLGALVLATGLYLLTAHMMTKSLLVGRLMLAYGIIMLILGAGMFVRLFSMMQWSLLSGAVMLASGTAMIYSGFDMVNM